MTRPMAGPGRGRGRVQAGTQGTRAWLDRCHDRHGRGGDRALAGGEYVRGGRPSVHGSDLIRAFDVPSCREPHTSGATTEWSLKRRVRRRQAAAGVGL